MSLICFENDPAAGQALVYDPIGHSDYVTEYQFAALAMRTVPCSSLCARSRTRGALLGADELRHVFVF
jgi:hypothetical protein